MFLSSSDVFEVGHQNIQPIIVICSFKFKDVFVGALCRPN